MEILTPQTNKHTNKQTNKKQIVGERNGKKGENKRVEILTPQTNKHTKRKLLENETAKREKTNERKS